MRWNGDLTSGYPWVIFITLLFPEYTSTEQVFSPPSGEERKKILKTSVILEFALILFPSEEPHMDQASSFQALQLVPARNSGGATA